MHADEIGLLEDSSSDQVILIIKLYEAEFQPTLNILCVLYIKFHIFFHSLQMFLFNEIV
jgi:hypothetical protein